MLHVSDKGFLNARQASRWDFQRIRRLARSLRSYVREIYM